MYQPAVDPFDAWDPLAELTKADRLRQGYFEDDPLLRRGQFRDSIIHRVMGVAAVVDTTDHKAVWQQYGTQRIPAWPFIAQYMLSFSYKIK